jgi:hypothetical protein
MVLVSLGLASEPAKNVQTPGAVLPHRLNITANLNGWPRERNLFLIFRNLLPISQL